MHSSSAARRSQPPSGSPQYEYLDTPPAVLNPRPYFRITRRDEDLEIQCDSDVYIVGFPWINNLSGLRIPPYDEGRPRPALVIEFSHYPPDGRAPDKKRLWPVRGSRENVEYFTALCPCGLVLLIPGHNPLGFTDPLSPKPLGDVTPLLPPPPTEPNQPQRLDLPPPYTFFDPQYTEGASTTSHIPPSQPPSSEPQQRARLPSSPERASGAR